MGWKMNNDIEALVKLALRSHRVCDDPWYNCPKADDDGGRWRGIILDCDCGADKHNEEVNEIARRLRDERT